MYRPPLALLVLAVALAAAGCASERNYVQSAHERITLAAGDLERGGLGVITPATVTGQEQDTQIVALVFSQVFAAERGDVPLVTLPEMLGRVNRNGLAGRYRAMLEHHAATGVLPREALRRVSEASGVRYVAQIKLADFRQSSATRWSLLGFRVLDTKRASLRLFLQIWDAERAGIAWEGMEELSYANDTATETQISLQTAVRAAAGRMIAALPGADAPPASP